MIVYRLGPSAQRLARPVGNALKHSDPDRYFYSERGRSNIFTVIRLEIVDQDNILTSRNMYLSGL